ncbi:hypothetical protein FisN_4Lu515 [Fistulifera solaris]|uniref:Glutaminyl-peptide cyclotransferase n=1 Tax=Fistulifera solaris TaxID=1519565 RepID=A0A1Z5JYZ0_FISSO|nr:hypothetical protein FisN_4Lu515 [Fistulifera solaris]|eukprot:GAX19263.1 hypothetical protein FisN_4Lu515 [Fistulifera solaris]
MAAKQRKNNKGVKGTEEGKRIDCNKQAKKTTKGSCEKQVISSSSPSYLWSRVAMWMAIISVAILAVSIIFPSRENASTTTTATQSTKKQKKQSSTPSNTRFGRFELLETVPHDGDAFTQGLQIVNDTLYEGVGHYGKSELRRVDLSTGKVLQRHKLPREFFGEGITYFEDGSTGQGRLLQLTWREQTAFLYDSESLQLLHQFSYNTRTGQGWGITWRQKQSTFIVSDGSSFLHFWDSQTFAETKRIEVYTLLHGGKGKVRHINEMEYEPVSDTLLANVWHNDVILRIDPDTGFVTTIYDLSSLYPPEQRSPSDNEAVLNGIALVEGKPDEVWVTGKLWSHMFRIRLIDPGDDEVIT